MVGLGHLHWMNLCMRSPRTLAKIRLTLDPSIETTSALVTAKPLNTEKTMMTQKYERERSPIIHSRIKSGDS
jgi:hypothetical protein